MKALIVDESGETSPLRRIFRGGQGSFIVQVVDGLNDGFSGMQLVGVRDVMEEEAGYNRLKGTVIERQILRSDHFKPAALGLSFFSGDPNHLGGCVNSYGQSSGRYIEFIGNHAGQNTGPTAQIENPVPFI